MKKIVSLILITVLSVSLIGCQKKEKQTETEQSNSTVQTVDTTENSAVEQQEVQEEAAVELLDIETQCGILHYPKEWENDLVISDSEENGIYNVYFSTNASDETVQLFKVMICTDEGDSVGTVTDSDGTVRNVFIDIRDLGDVSGYDEETQNKLFAMQEAVNVLTENLDK